MKQPNSQDELTGVQRAAVLLLSLGENDAAEVLKHMGAKEVQKLGLAMATMSAVSREQVLRVMDDFEGALDKQTSLGVGADDYIRNVLIQALGADKASSLIDRILLGRNTTGLDTLKWMDPRAVADLVRNEHPQIIAIVLSHLTATRPPNRSGSCPSAPAPTCCCGSPPWTASRPTRSTSSTRSWSASSPETRT